MRTELTLPRITRPESQSREVLASRVIAAALAALAIAVGIWLRDWRVGLGLGSIPAVLMAATYFVKAETPAPSRRPTPIADGFPPLGRAQLEGSRPQESAPVKPADAVAEIDLSPIAPLTVGEVQVTVIRGSITDQQVDVIVNAANRFLRGGSGVDAAIEKAAGRAPYDECAEKYPADDHGTRCPPGSCVWTGPGRLAEKGVKGIVHAVGPVWNASTPAALAESEQDLFSANGSAVALADDHEATSVALPFLSAGVFGAPWPEAAELAVRGAAGAAYAASHLKEVRFVIFEKEAWPHFRAAFEVARKIEGLQKKS